MKIKITLFRHRYLWVVLSALFTGQCIDTSAFAETYGDSPTVANQLSWVYTGKIEQKSLCEGYYTQPNLGAFGQPIQALQRSQTSITADRVEYTANGPVIFSGNVVVRQPGRRLEANQAVLYRNAKTNKLTFIDLTENVRTYEAGKMFVGQSAHLNIVNKSGVINHALYRVVLVDDTHLHQYTKPLNANTQQIAALTGWGQADQAIQHSPGHTEFTQATYSTCPPGTGCGWHVKASDIKLDKTKERGVARNATLYFNQVPVFYSPYFSFPLSKKRKTGFLYPMFGSSNISGPYLGLPFYWNIAPNYDATITPKIYGKRGVLMSGLFRYLTQWSSGSFFGSYIGSDKAFRNFQNSAFNNPAYINQFGYNALLNAKDSRNIFRWQDKTRFSPHVTANVDFTHVSDDYFMQDFGSVPSQITTNQVLRQANITYRNDHWTILSLVQSYLTLHPVNRQAVPNLYNRLPEFDANANYPDFFKGLDFTLHSQAVYFTNTIGPEQKIKPIVGGRYDFQPGLSLPLYQASGYFIPSIKVALDKYTLQQTPVGTPANISRGVPTFNIDSGLYLDRYFAFGNYNFHQTLEPRLFYLFVPYTNQNNIPEFDSAIIPFSYDQLFRTNRFSGFDRIGDANQVSLGITTRLFDANSGLEKFHASIGQIYYFRKRQVTLCQTPGCTDQFTSIGATSSVEPVSPIAGQASYFLNPLWSINGNIAWDPNQRITINSAAYFQYHPGAGRVFNFGYNFIRNGNIINNQYTGSSKNNFNQISFSYAWPLTYHWSSLGLYSYSISQNRDQSYLLGLQYDTCCWAVRMLGGKTFTTLDQTGKPLYNNAVYFQLVLKGLANFDPNNTSTTLASQIAGYRDPLTQTPTFLTE